MAYHLFERFGVELEYMVVDQDTLAAAPVVDRLLQEAAKLPGAKVESESEPGWPDEVSLGPISLSNELVMHVLEFKATEPVPQLHGVSSLFQDAIRKVMPILEREGCMLLPGGMHPTMNPDAEMRLWPHGNSEVYEAFNKIFDCRGHGWANLQACHLNLPFGVEDVESESGEFGRLHAAIRAILPILPALSAASPIMDGKVTGLMDNRLEVYRTNSKRIPQAAGKVIPERVFTKSAYDREIFQKIYKAYEPHDPEGVLRFEWANSRGCIARFMRNAIEIRVLDVQESPRVDLAICSAITSVLRAMCGSVGGEAGRAGSPTAAALFDLAALQRLDVEPLHATLLSCIKDAERAVITDGVYLKALGVSSPSCTAGELWRHLLDRTSANDATAATWRPVVDLILTRGPLSRRVLAAIGKDVSAKSILGVYRRLAGCLASNSPFQA
jgi:glutamate---cysteine ligase / carboxylate-amine ligase